MENQTAITTKPINPALILRDADAFGCCASYRACSDAGKCLVTDTKNPPPCFYRLNLEAGRIFYGKNANDFSPSFYDKVLRAVDSLSPQGRKALDEVLLVLLVYNRVSYHMVARSGAVSELTSLGLFDIRPMGRDFPQLCGFSELKAAIRANADYSARYGAAQDARKAELKGKSKEERDSLPGPQTQAFLEEWLNGEAADIRDALAAPYCSVNMFLNP